MQEQNKQQSGISYSEKPGQTITVLVGGKVAGHIRSNREGYVYAPKGSTLRGKTFATVAEVKQSLEQVPA